MFDRRLFAMAPGVRPYVLASVALQWVALLANIAFVFAIALTVQGLLEGDISPAWPLVVVGVGAVAVALRVTCLTLSQKAGVKAAAIAKRETRTRVYAKLACLGPAYTESVSTAEALQVCVEGAEQLEGYFGSYAPQLLYALVAPLTLFACLAPLCLPAAAVLLACVPLIPLSIVAVQRVAKRVMGDYWETYTDLGATFLDNLQGLATLKIFQADENRHELMNAEAERFRRATMRLLAMQLNSVTVMDLFAFGGAAVGIIVTALLFAQGAIAFWVAFAIVFLAAEFFLPLRALGSYFHTAMGGMAVAEKMYRILDAPEPDHGQLEVPEHDVAINAHDLSYAYDGSRKVLDDVEFSAPAGSFTAIVGESGSGKSTLAGVLSGCLRGYEGAVSIGDVSLHEAAAKSLSAVMTVVPHASYLFEGTVRSNLLMACPQADDAQLDDALHRAHAAGFVEEMGGLDARILEGGSNLSGGQRQRIAFARALLHDTPVYLFDEATSNVDAESEGMLFDVIHALARDKTVIVISHRLASVCDADEIYVMKEGRVAEHGTHDALLARGGAYAALWNQQAALEALVDDAVPANGAGIEEAADVLPACSMPTAMHAPAADDVDCERRRSHFSVMRGMLGLVRPLAGWMVLAVVLGVAGFAAAIFLTVFGMCALVDVAGQPQGVGFAAALVLVAVCGVVRGPLRYGEQMCNHYLAFKLLALVRDHVFGALRRLAPARLEGRQKGDLVSLVTGDIELLEVFYAHTLSPVLIAAIVSVGMVVFMACLSPWLAVVAAIAYMVVGVLMPLVGSHASGNAGHGLRAGIARLNAFVLDSLRGLRETLQFGASAQRARELSERIGAQEDLERVQKGRTALFTSAVNGVVFAFDVIAIVAAGTLVGSGQLSGGAALVAIAAFMSSFGPVIAVANLGTTLQQTLASGARVLDLLDEQPQTHDVVDGTSPDTFTGATARHVDFSYGRVPVLQDVSLSVEPGSIVQVAGRSGSGKSTLFKLFLRFWDPSSGTIELSGHDVREVLTTSLRDMESCMTQDTHLFAGTLAENVLLARSDATAAELAEACRKAALDEVLDRLPRGLDTQVGELGDALSGGERQRIGLARMFLHDAPFMLLDEPTSNLDSLNEAVVLRAILEERGQRTVLLVSHRASTAAIADKVITVECGRVS